MMETSDANSLTSTASASPAATVAEVTKSNKYVQYYTTTNLMTVQSIVTQSNKKNPKPTPETSEFFAW